MLKRVKRTINRVEQRWKFSRSSFYQWLRWQIQNWEKRIHTGYRKFNEFEHVTRALSLLDRYLEQILQIAKNTVGLYLWTATGVAVIFRLNEINSLSQHRNVIFHPRLMIWGWKSWAEFDRLFYLLVKGLYDLSLSSRRRIFPAADLKCTMFENSYGRRSYYDLWRQMYPTSVCHARTSLRLWSAWMERVCLQACLSPIIYRLYFVFQEFYLW